MTAMIRDIGILSHETQCCLMFGHVVGVGACKRVGLPVWLLRTDCPRLTINYQVEWTSFLWYFSPSNKWVGAKKTREMFIPWSHGIPPTHEIRGSLEPDNISSHQNLGTLYLAVRHSKLSKMVIIEISCELRLYLFLASGESIRISRTQKLVVWLGLGDQTTRKRGKKSVERCETERQSITSPAANMLSWSPESFIFMVDRWLIYSCSGETFHSGHAMTCPYDPIWLNELSPTKWLVHCRHIIPYLSTTTLN